MSTRVMHRSVSASAVTTSRAEATNKEEAPEVPRWGGRSQSQAYGAWGRVTSFVEPHLACLCLVPMLIGAGAVWLGLWPGYLWAGILWGLAGWWLAHEYAIAPLLEEVPEREERPETVPVEGKG